MRSTVMRRSKRSTAKDSYAFWTEMICRTPYLYLFSKGLMQMKTVLVRKLKGHAILGSFNTD